MLHITDVNTPIHIKNESERWRFDPQSRNYYNRKMKKTNFMVAHNALAHKLARAAYYVVIKDQVPFMPEKMFAT